MRRLPLLLALLTACSDYDLYRPDADEAPGDPEVEPDPEPEEAPDIALSPSSLDFGSVLKDCISDPLTVTVTNEGLGTLNITDITLEGNGGSSFEHTGTSLSLEYGEQTTFAVTFTPAAWLDYDVNVVVASNDPDEPEAKVEALGTGASGALFEEGFTQDYNELVDVLWVVDNSGSMGDDLANIGTNFDSFIDEFSNLELDYHIAVVTTDMDNPADSGRFQGEVITASTADPIAAFAAQVNQGATGSGTEQGLGAAYAALTEPLLSTTNAGFLREEATLSIIVVTDENDSSGISASSFVSWLQGLKAEPDMARFNGFFDTLFEDFFSWGDGYITVVEDTGGFYDSINTSSFDLALQELSFAAAGMTVIFYLTEEPATLSDMTVTVDGVTIAQDSENGWTYDSETNALTFNGDSIPGPGSSVNVSYTTVSECG